MVKATINVTVSTVLTININVTYARRKLPMRQDIECEVLSKSGMWVRARVATTPYSMAEKMTPSPIILSSGWVFGSRPSKEGCNMSN